MRWSFIIRKMWIGIYILLTDLWRIFYILKLYFGRGLDDNYGFLLEWILASYYYGNKDFDDEYFRSIIRIEELRIVYYLMSFI